MVAPDTQSSESDDNGSSQELSQGDSVRPAPAPRWLLCTLVAALVAWGAQAVGLALCRHFSTDEFGYAHMGWLLAKGIVPYRDFFDAHPPFFALFNSVVFRLGGDNPQLILGLRGLMLIPLGVSLWAAALLGRNRGTEAALLAPLLLLAAPGYVHWVTEVRPDALAFALFLSAVALIDAEFFSRRTRSFLVGALATLACFTTIKALIYVSVLPCVLAIHWLLMLRTGERSSSKVDLLTTLLGAACTSGLFVGYLASQGALALAWQNCIVWSREQQAAGHSFSWRLAFDAVMRDHLGLLAFAVVGLAHETVSVIQRQGRSLGRAVLALALLPALASHAIQRTAYAYNLLPWIGLLALWAASGLAWSLTAASRWPTRCASLLTGGALLLHLEYVLLDDLGVDNRQQLGVLGKIAQLTTATDCVYDNAGSAVSRPHAYYHFYTDNYMRAVFSNKLATEVPLALEQQRCVMRVIDLRSELLSPELLAYLRTHYQPFDGDLALSGQRYAAANSDGVDVEFLAVDSANYFTFPAVDVSVDGKPLGAGTFHLEAGRHRLRSLGPHGEFYVLWLPRDGKPWLPHPGLAPTFSTLF